jgi:hypothetical protein
MQKIPSYLYVYIYVCVCVCVCECVIKLRVPCVSMHVGSSGNKCQITLHKN